MKIRKIHAVNILILYFLHLIPSVSWASGILCDGPTDAVQIIVKQESELPPTYSYIVKNLHKSPIKIIAVALGESDHEEMYSVQDNVPKTFVSPKGWEGGASFTDESVFMRIFWKTKNPVMIAPGQLFGGFKVEMPRPLMKKGEIYDLYGTPIEALDMRKVSFNVFLEDGVCVWGRVQEKE